MVHYTNRVYTHTIRTRDALALSGNIAILAVFYTFVGALLSYALYYIFDEYNEEWKQQTLFYQFADVSLEIAVIVLVSFWLVFGINTSAPIFPIPAHLGEYVDTYTTGMFFMFSVFLFMNGLTSKLTHLYEAQLETTFNRLFPNKGSLLQFNLRYE